MRVFHQKPEVDISWPTPLKRPRKKPCFITDMAHANSYTDPPRAQRHSYSGQYYNPSGSRNAGQSHSTSLRDPHSGASYFPRVNDYAPGPPPPAPPQPQPQSQLRASSTSFVSPAGTGALQDIQVQGIPPFPSLNPEMYKDLPNPPDPRDKQVMYRVRGIPNELPPEVITQSLLDELFPGNKRVKVEGELKIIQGEGQDVEQDTQIALIQFSEKPEAFSKKSIYFLQCWRGASIDNTFYGFTTLFAGKGERIIADIIAVTGLSAHAYGSWKGRDGHKEMWLHDFLPQKFPDCRIMIHGYESDIIQSSGINRLEDYVNEFLEELDKKRPTSEEKRRPIIFIGHSLGGLIVTHVRIRKSIT
ncbi:hypothetical protein DFP73DRAFT_238567 [Morchella snyderi]|nr:hypothetical protein DFP73DRAFT_238567 [Morchella snyderi]